MAEGELRFGQIAEAATGGFVGAMASTFAYRIPIGNTTRARLVIGSTVAVLGASLVGWLVSKLKNRAPLAAGLVAGGAGFGLLGFFSLLIIPAAALDVPVGSFRSPTPNPLQGLSSLGLHRRRRFAHAR